MTAQAAQNFPRFPRPAFGFSSKSRTPPKTEENDEDWYIPYNGPYEAPRELPTRRKARDSWGDPLEFDDEEDTVFNDKELQLRYGGHNDPSYGDRHFEEERMGRRRDRTFSVNSGQSVSSGTIDPSRSSIGYKRSTVSSGARHFLPSYISMDANTGGVGESPIPPHRSSQEKNRTTLAGIFSFNAHSRKPSTNTSTSTERTQTGSFVRKPSLLQRSNVYTGDNNEKVYGNVDPPARYSSSSEHANSYVKDKNEQLRHQVMLYADRLSSVAHETDYYNTYYSTLVHEQRSDVNHHRHRPSLSTSEDFHHSQQPPFDFDRQKTSFTTRPIHPYARAIPRNSDMPLKVLPIRLSNPPRPATSHTPNNIKPHNSSITRVTIPRSPLLRNSTSTPDLRYSAVLHDAVVTPDNRNSNLIPQPIAMPQFVLPKAKDRWLSAETWCDALLFPRPRLKSGTVPTLGGSSGRIVSPPGSPVRRSVSGSTGTQEPSVVSRVLAHSRSLMDLNTQVGLSSSYRYPPAISAAHERDPRAGLQPTTFAQDDLALPSPIPSLRRYVFYFYSSFTFPRR
jgi:serine/arginine repetitive matrix protein 2